jgi:hypothetical protein
MLTRWIQRSRPVAEDAIEYECEYREAEYEYEEDSTANQPERSVVPELRREGDRRGTGGDTPCLDGGDGLIGAECGGCKESSERLRPPIERVGPETRLTSYINADRERVEAY